MNTIQYIHKVQSGELDTILSTLYGNENLLGQKKRYSKAIQQFHALYGDCPISIYATPGRTEIAGNHTDHNHGIVVAASVNIDMLTIVSTANGEEISLYTEGFGQLPPISIVNDLQICPTEFGLTKALIKGVCTGIKDKGGIVGGFKAYMTSDILVGSGLSSSAAFEVSIGTILNEEFNGGKFTPIEIAQIGQYAENQYFGKPCGLMDQIACSVGGVTVIDFHTPLYPSVTPLTFDLATEQLSLCIVDTGSSHENLTVEYQSIKDEMVAVAQYFGKDVLGELEQAEFYGNIGKIRGKVSDRAILRGMHFYMECSRATAIGEAIAKQDIDTFLLKVMESGHSSFEYNQNAFVHPQYQPIGIALATAQRLLQDTKGAWRLHGGGFAGTIQCFVPIGLLPIFTTSMEAVLGKGCCHILSIRNCGAIKIKES